MIQIALVTKFQLETKIRPEEFVGAIHDKFLQERIGDVLVRFTMEEDISARTSTIDKILKSFPEMKQFDHFIFRPNGHAGSGRKTRRIGNDACSPSAGVSVDLTTLLAIVSDVPKRFPLFSVAVRITSQVFGGEPSENTKPIFWPGLIILDRWGVSKRRVSLTAVAIVETDPDGDVAPCFPDSIAVVLKAFGRHSRPEQIVLPDQNPDLTRKAAVIAKSVRDALSDVVIRTQMPHNFNISNDHAPQQSVGPFKPVLIDAFHSLGYDCRASGTMVLVCSRRAKSNVVTNLYLDFGTWGKKVDPTYFAHWFGFSIAISLPVCPRSELRTGGWIVDKPRWRQIAENLAVLVAELDRTVLPLIEEVAGFTPAWYEADATRWPTRLQLPPMVLQDQQKH